jgi:hypothetical protein
MRRVLWLLVWVVVVPVVSVVVPPSVSPVSAGACDADGDGRASGFTDDWLSDGSDTTAARLAADAGRSLSSAAAGYRWEVPVCVEGAAVSVIGSISRVLAPSAPLWEASAVAGGTSALQALYWSPAPLITPSVDGLQVVGLETWLAIDPSTWVTLHHTEVYGEVIVHFQAIPQATIWTFTDLVKRCPGGPGVVYTPGAAGPAPCGRDWDHTTSVGPMTMEVVIEYQVLWTSSIGGAGAFVTTGAPLARYDLAVGEIQTIGALGDNPHPASPGLAPDPPYDTPGDCSLQEFARGDCAQSRQGGGCSAFSWGGVKNCITSGVGAVIDAGQWAFDNLAQLALQIKALLPGWAKAILDVLEGCAEFGIDAVAGLWNTVKTIGDALDDPVGFVQEKLGELQAIMAAIEENPREFAEQFLGDLAELDLLRTQPAKWVGKIGCELALTIFTAGAAGSARMARLTDKIDDITDWVNNKRRRDRNNDNNDPDGNSDPDSSNCSLVTGICECNSFPAGTRVRLASGDHLPIESISPGQLVATYDTGTARWGAAPVLAQWSAIDRGWMATVVLADGSRVTATDHHRIWVDGEGRWVEADRLDPGDLLLGPDGVTAVESVELVGPVPTRVWELDVADDDNFLVAGTGGAEVLVHNCDEIELRRSQNLDLMNDPDRFAADLDKAGVTRSDIDLMLAKRKPLGFASEREWQSFQDELRDVLARSGLDDAEIGLKGTATTFYSENPNKPFGHHWDADPANPGDFDFNVLSQRMMDDMAAAGIEPSRLNIFATRYLEAEYPELARFAARWSEQLGRPVNFVGLPGTSVVRDPTEYVLGSG